jgi:hypothetical protein
VDRARNSHVIEKLDGRLETERDEWRRRALAAEAEVVAVLEALGHSCCSAEEEDADD